MSLEEPTSSEEAEFDTVIGVLDDAGCRAIVSALEEPMTVEEIAETTDQPLSTTYRKLDRLDEASLVNDVSSGPRGQGCSRYITDFDRIVVELDESRTLRVRVRRAKNCAVEIWTNATQGF